MSAPIAESAGQGPALRQAQGPGQRPDWPAVFRRIVSGGWLVAVVAVVLALVVGSILICATDEGVQAAGAYFFSRPGDTFAAIGNAIGSAYTAFFQGAVYNFRVPDFGHGIRPLTETLTFAAPLIAAGLGIALTFRAGLFNIGGQGQMVLGAAMAGWIGFGVPMPPVLHTAVAILVGMLAGAAWSGLAGLLKATTGAHEVITTIMLNYVGTAIVAFLLATPGLLQAPGSPNPKSPPMLPSAVLLRFFGQQFDLHFGIVLAVLAAVLVWWIMDRSSLGFKLRAVGLNPHAARTAGMDVKRLTVISMALSGAFVGLAGTFQVLGTQVTGFGQGIDAGIGFDAITVALLGRSNPWGVLGAGVLLGAFKAGGYSMQSSGVPIDIITVVQSLIVLFLAAPPLVRAIIGIRAPKAVAA